MSGAASGGAGGCGEAFGELAERRLRRLGSFCAVPAAAALVGAGAAAWALARAGEAAGSAQPPGSSFLAAFGAMILILLSRPLRNNILRRADEAEVAGEAELDGDREEAARAEPAEKTDRSLPAACGAGQDAGPLGAAPGNEIAARRLDAYTWATLAGSGMLAAATALGLWVAAAGNAAFYGLVICLAALLAMAAAWPRRGDLDEAIGGRRPTDRT